MPGYAPLDSIEVGPPSRRFVLDAEWRDISIPSEDRTVWSVRQRPSSGPACSFRVIVTGSAAASSSPLPATEALKRAVSNALSSELMRLQRAGQVPGESHPVIVTRQQLLDAGVLRLSH